MLVSCVTQFYRHTLLISCLIQSLVTPSVLSCKIIRHTFTKLYNNTPVRYQPTLLLIFCCLVVERCVLKTCEGMHRRRVYRLGLWLTDARGRALEP